MKTTTSPQPHHTRVRVLRSLGRAMTSRATVSERAAVARSERVRVEQGHVVRSFRS